MKSESGDLGVGFGVVIPASELAERVSRAGGPGGQHVNKVATKVTLVWNVTTSAALDAGQRARVLHRLGPRLTGRGELVVQAQSERAQVRNRNEARRRLAALVHAALVPERTRRATKPGRSAVQRRLDAKKRRSESKRSRRPVRDVD